MSWGDLLTTLSIFGLKDIPEVKKDDRISDHIIHALDSQKMQLKEKDIIVIASKVISKAEGRVVKKESIKPSSFACQLAKTLDRNPHQVEVILSETKYPIKISNRTLIMETKHGFVCANAGVDQSNIAKECFLLLPTDPDKSAQRIRKALERFYKVNIAVIITDTFGRPWRKGQTNVAVGLSGMEPIKSYDGKIDSFGNELKATEIAVADEIAGAAELITGKTSGVPVCVVRGYDYQPSRSGVGKLLRSRSEDLFR